MQESISFSSSTRHSHGSSSVTWSGLTTEELDRLEATLNGNGWVRIKDGRLECVPAYMPTPTPVEDPAVPPRWTFPHNGRRPKYDVVDQPAPGRNLCSPSILIQHIGVCGRALNDSYKSAAGRLESWGFECCRSRRGDNGKYWELWFLPYLRAAEGDLLRTLTSYCSKCGATTERGRPLDHPNCPNMDYPGSLKEACGPGTMVQRDKCDDASQLGVAFQFLMRYGDFGTLDVMVQRAAATID